MTQDAEEKRLTWKSKQAWQCVLALIVIEALISLWLRIAQSRPAAADWLMLHADSVQTALKFFRAGVWLFVAYWFSSLEKPRDFVERTGLSQRPTLRGWCGAWFAIGIGLLDLYGVARGW